MCRSFHKRNLSVVDILLIIFIISIIYYTLYIFIGNITAGIWFNEAYSFLNWLILQIETVIKFSFFFVTDGKFLKVSVSLNVTRFKVKKLCPIESLGDFRYR